MSERKVSGLSLPAICEQAAILERKYELAFLSDIFRHFLLNNIRRAKNVEKEIELIEPGNEEDLRMHQIILAGLNQDNKDAADDLEESKLALQSKGISADNLALIIDNVQRHVIKYLSELDEKCLFTARELGNELRRTKDVYRRTPETYNWITAAPALAPALAPVPFVMRRSSGSSSGSSSGLPYFAEAPLTRLSSGGDFPEYSEFPTLGRKFF
jgi:hypothetical protein